MSSAQNEVSQPLGNSEFSCQIQTMVVAELGGILKRIDRRLKIVELSDRAASLQAGLSADAIRTARRQHRSDKQHSMSARVVNALAVPLKCHPHWLMYGDGPEGIEENAGRPVALVERRNGEARGHGLRCLGAVAAGTWLEISDDVLNGAHETETEIPFDPRYSANHQYAVVVRGTSINRVANDGDFLIVLDRAHIEPQAGDLVVAARTRKGASLREVAAKRLAVVGKDIELRNDSTDPRYATATQLRFKAGGKSLTDDSETVEIKGVVLGVYRPL